MKDERRIRRYCDKRLPDGTSPIVASIHGVRQAHGGYSLEEEEMEFIRAISEYKRTHDCPFPTWSQVLHVVKSLGYAKDEGKEDELEFVGAIDAYKRQYHCKFPTWSEVLHVLKSLGYAKRKEGEEGKG